MSLVNKACLVLNASYEPLAISSARRAITLFVKERCTIVEDYGREVYPGIMLPSVIRLTTYQYIPMRVTQMTRKNIYSRDHNACQYCGRRPGGHNLTLDHVIPKSRGGPNTWQNLVTCCRRCNKIKDDRTPEEAGMKLRRKPSALNIHTSRSLLRLVGLEEDERWAPYLFA